MAKITRLVIHCTATREGQDASADTIRRWHTTPKAQGGRGWSDIGYHYVVRLDGSVEKGRPDDVPGAHAAGFNTGSIGIVYVGGLDASGRPKDTRTVPQKASLAQLVRKLHREHGAPQVLGHRDLSPDRNGDGRIDPSEWMKACPCFDVASELPSWLRGEAAPAAVPVNRCGTCGQPLPA